VKNRDIKKIAEEYKNINGNSAYSNKDLLWYIISRLDSLEKSDSKQDAKIMGIKTQLGIFWVLLPIAITIAIYIGSLS